MIYFLKIILYKIKEMNIARAVSVLALLISVGGLGISAWNIIISKHSFNHAFKVHQKEEDKNFEQLKFDFLIQIADDLEIMNQYLIEIYKIQIQLNADPNSVKDSMKNSFSKLNRYTTIVIFSLAKLNLEWKTAVSYSNTDGSKKLIIDTATFYNCKTNIVLKESIQNSIDEFSMNLQEAEKKDKVYSSISPGVLASKIFFTQR